MNMDYVSLLFDPLEKLRPRIFPRDVFGDFTKLLLSLKGFPNMEPLLSAVSSPKLVKIQLLPPFF